MADGKQPKDQAAPGEVKLPLSFVIPEGIVSRYATNFVVQCTGHEFGISFFEAESPFLLGDDPEENRAILEAAETVRAQCVARIVVSPEGMRQFAGVVKSSLARYSVAKGEQDE